MKWVLFLVWLAFASTSNSPVAEAKKVSLDSIQLNTKCGAVGTAKFYFQAQVYGDRAETATLTIGVDLPSSPNVGTEYNLKQDLIYWKNTVDSYSLNTLSLDLYLQDVYDEDPLLAHFVVDWNDLPSNTFSYRQVKMFREGSDDERCPSDNSDPDSVILWLWAESIDPALIDSNGLYMTSESTSSSSSFGMYLILGASALAILIALCGPFYYFCCTAARHRKPPIVLYDDVMSQYSQSTACPSIHTDLTSVVSSVPPSTRVSSIAGGREPHRPRRRRRYSRSPPPRSRSFVGHPPSTVHSRTPSFTSVSRPVSVSRPRSVVSHARRLPHLTSSQVSPHYPPTASISPPLQPATVSVITPPPVTIQAATAPVLTQHASVVNHPVAFRPVVVQPAPTPVRRVVAIQQAPPAISRVVYRQNPV